MRNEQLESDVTSATQAGSGQAILSEAIDQARFSFSQMLIIGICILLNVLDGFDITTMAVSKKAIAGDLGLSASQLGYLDGVALAGMCLGAMFLGALSDLIGRRRMIMISISVIAVAMFLTALVQNFAQFFVIRLITGLGVGAMLASIATIASEFAPERYRSLAVTVATAGYPLGAMLGGTFGPGLISNWGWQGVFYFGAAATAVTATIAMLLLPESLQFLLARQPRNALAKANRVLERINASPLAVLPPPSGQAHAGVMKTVFGLFDNLGGLFRDGLARKTLLLWLTFFLCFIGLYFLMSWIPFLIEDSGFSRAQGGQAFALFNVGGVLGILMLGALSTRFHLTATIGTFLLLSAVFMVVFANAQGSFGMLMGLILVIGIMQQGGFTGLYACAAKIYPSEIKATGLGWAIGLGRIGAVAGPAIAGVLIDRGIDMNTNFMIFAVPMLLGGLMAYTLKVR